VSLNKARKNKTIRHKEGIPHNCQWVGLWSKWHKNILRDNPPGICQQDNRTASI